MAKIVTKNHFSGGDIFECLHALLLRAVSFSGVILSVYHTVYGYCMPRMYQYYYNSIRICLVYLLA